MSLAIVGCITSIFMGLSLGMIGGGGSILTVPILVYLFQIDPSLATAYSLFIVGLTALFGGINYYRKGEVDLKTGFIFATPSFIGVYLVRSFVIPNLPQNLFSIGDILITKPLFIMLVFALLMVVASFSMIRSKKSENKKSEFSPMTKYLLIGLEGLLVGGVTGFVGAGGGFLIIPALVILVGLPMKIAVGTSLFIIAAKSLLGFIGDVQHQPYIDWALLFQISAIAITGLFIGVKVSDKVSEKTLKKGFGYFVLIMGSAILFDQIRRM
jgi:uncharacterized membrane protein YfcA